MSHLPSDPPDLTSVRRMWADDAASAHLGMEATLIEVDHAVVRMTIREHMVNGHGIAHGGYTFTLADSTFALVCNSRGRLTVAAGADIVFVASALLGDVLVAEGVSRTAYGRCGVTDVRVTQESDGAVIAEFRGRSRAPAAGELTSHSVDGTLSPRHTEPSRATPRRHGHSAGGHRRDGRRAARTHDGRRPSRAHDVNTWSQIKTQPTSRMPSLLSSLDSMTSGLRTRWRNDLVRGSLGLPMTSAAGPSSTM